MTDNKNNETKITPEDIDKAVEQYVFSKREKGEDLPTIEETLGRLEFTSAVLKRKEEKRKKNIKDDGRDSR